MNNSKLEAYIDISSCLSSKIRWNYNLFSILELSHSRNPTHAQVYNYRLNHPLKVNLCKIAKLQQNPTKKASTTKHKIQ